MSHLFQASPKSPGKSEIASCHYGYLKCLSMVALALSELLGFYNKLNQALRTDIEDEAMAASAAVAERGPKR